MAETHARSILKGISWRFNATIITMLISWVVTSEVSIALSIAGIEVVAKIVWYYLHERVWIAIPWGKQVAG